MSPASCQPHCHTPSARQWWSASQHPVGHSVSTAALTAGSGMAGTEGGLPSRRHSWIGKKQPRPHAVLIIFSFQSWWTEEKHLSLKSSCVQLNYCCDSVEGHLLQLPLHRWLENSGPNCRTCLISSFPALVLINSFPNPEHVEGIWWLMPVTEAR